MNSFFRRLFHLFPGEERNAFAFALLGFLWSFGITSGLKFADALFLLHVGADSLPSVYMITACIMIVLAAFLLKAFHSFAIDRLFIAVLATGVAFYAFAHTCFNIGWGVGEEASWLWYLLRISGTILFSISLTCYWSFVDQYYHLQDAKRLYTLFTSAIFLGVATTGMIMRSGLLDFPQLTIGIIIVLLAAGFWTHRLSKRLQPVYDDNALEGRGEEEESSFGNLVRSIINSKFTLLLMAGNFLTYVLMIITEYSYLADFDARFDPGITMQRGDEEKARLTQFLGECLAGVSVINLIFGLFVYSRLVRRFGTNNLVMLTPLLMLLNFSGWSVSQALLFPIIGFFIVEGMLYIVDDNNFTLLLNAVPARMKFKIRLIIESFMEPVGMLISSLLITFLTINSKLLGLSLAAISLIIALLLRKQYLKAIFKNLSENAIQFQRTVKEWFEKLNTKNKKATERRLLALLRISDEQTQLLATEWLIDIADSGILSKMLAEIESFSPEAKIKFLDQLSVSPLAKEKSVIEVVESWAFEGEDQRLTGAAQFYLAAQDALNLKKAYEGLNNPDIQIQAAAILALRRHHPEKVQASLQSLLLSDDPRKIGLALMIIGRSGSSSDSDIEQLIAFLKHSSQRVVRHAAQAISQLIQPTDKFIAPILIAQLTATDGEVRQACLRALGKLQDPELAKTIILSSIPFRPNERRLTETIVYQMGMPIFPTLLEILKDSGTNERARVLAGRILGRLDLKALRAELFDLIDIEIDRAFFYYYHYHAIPPQYPHADLTLLQDDLLSSFHAVLDFIIQLLGIAGESEDCELLSRSLRNPSPKVRSQVIETLEKSCEPKIYRELYPLIAELPKEEKMAIYLKRGYKPLSLQELLDKMDESTIYGDQIVAIALKYRLDLPNWRESLKAKVAKKEEILHHFAYELLET